MGKRRKRLTMTKYAKKYEKKRAALGFAQPESVEKETNQEPVVEKKKPEPVKPVPALKEITTKTTRKRRATNSKTSATTKDKPKTTKKTTRKRRTKASS